MTLAQLESGCSSTFDFARNTNRYGDVNRGEERRSSSHCVQSVCHDGYHIMVTVVMHNVVVTMLMLCNGWSCHQDQSACEGAAQMRD